MLAIGPNTQPKTSFVAVIGGGGTPLVDPVPDFQFNYRLDGTDANITRVGGNDFVGAPECPDAVGQNYDGTTQSDTANPDSGLVAVGPNPFSISLWFSTPATGNLRDFLSSGDGTSSTFRFSISTTGQITIRTANTDTNFGSGFDDGGTHHVAITSKGAAGEMICYIDGSSVGTQVGAIFNLIDSGLLGIGIRPDNNTSRFEGMLDGIRFYDRDLTPQEVTDLSNYRCD